MEPVRFADGFDGPDKVALGLSPGGLGVVAGGLALAYLGLHSGLPGPVTGALAAVCLLGAALVGWGRWADRPLVEWAVSGLGYLRGPRALTVSLRGPEQERVRSGPDATAPRPAQRGPAAAAGEGLAAPPSPVPPPSVSSSSMSSPLRCLAPPAPGPPVTTGRDGEPAWARWLDEPVPVPGAARQIGADSGDPGSPDSAAAVPAPSSALSESDHPAHQQPERSSWEHLSDELVRWVEERVRTPGEPLPRADQDAGSRPSPLVVLRDRADELGPPSGRDGDRLELQADLSRGKGLPDSPRPDFGCRPARGRARRVTFFGLSGGVGRTTLATEVGCLLAARGGIAHPTRARLPRRVAYVDLDPIASAASVRLGSRAGLGGQTVVPGQDGFLLTQEPAQHPSGLVTIWSPPASSLATGGDDLAAAAAAVFRRLEAEGVDLILVDCNGQPPALATWVLETCDDIYIVLGDSARGVRDAYRAAASLRRLGFADKLAYVVNLSSGRVDFGPTMGDLGGALLATIPRDPVIAEAEDAHRIASLESDSPGTRAIHRLAAAMHSGPASAGALDLRTAPWESEHEAALGVR